MTTNSEGSLTDERVRTSLGELVQILAADEVEMNVGPVVGDTVEITLIFGADTCEECVLPVDRLTRLVEMKLAQSDLASVKPIIRDPRVAIE
jgi:hypothetical protein